MTGVDDFPDGFFTRADETPDRCGGLYRELAVDGDVLDLMASWVSHFECRPRNLTVLGMNTAELDHHQMAAARVVHDLNADPVLPFGDATFDAAVASSVSRWRCSTLWSRLGRFLLA